MGVHDVGRLSLGQWAAICRTWTRAHDQKANVSPPSEDEFEAAVLAARGAG